MATRLENLARIRQLLGTPYPSDPSFTLLFQLELSAEQDLLNQLNNTDRPWGVNVTQINYTPGLSQYNIDATDFGKPILVTRLLPQNPYIKKLPVPFQDINHQLYGTLWWNNWDSLYGYWNWGYTETIERMTFARSGILDAQPYVTIEPQPQMSAVYEITYVPNTCDENGSLESQIQMPELSTLVQLRTATAALPYARWSEDEAVNSQRRKELAQGFKYQLDIKEPIASRLISAMVKPRDVMISNWNSAY